MLVELSVTTSETNEFTTCPLGVSYRSIVMEYTPIIKRSDEFICVNETRVVRVSFSEYNIGIIFWDTFCLDSTLGFDLDSGGGSNESDGSKFHIFLFFFSYLIINQNLRLKYYIDWPYYPSFEHYQIHLWTLIIWIMT